MKRKSTLRTISVIVLAVLVLSLGFAAFAVSTVRAAAITVNTTDDELNLDGDCSLREAITAANTDAAVDACQAGSGADTINLPAGDYILSLIGNEDHALSGDLDIRQDLNLVGAGPLQTTIDANGIDRVFHILTNAAVQISNMSITGGNSGSMAGGDILLDTGSLTLSRVRVRNSAAHAGIHVLSTATELTILDSRIEANAGSGLLLSENVSALVKGSTISGNVNDHSSGGGIENLGELTIVNSTISGNKTTNFGGGIYTSGSGSVHLYNVTISNNEANYDNDSFGEAGGIAFYGIGVLTARNTIIAANLTNSTSTLYPDCFGKFTSQGYNLIQAVSGCTITGDTTGNILGVDGLMGPLQINDGTTFTHALLLGSPAIDAGDPAGCSDQNGALLGTDQRGFARNGRCDIGAYEYNSAGTPTPTLSALPPALYLPVILRPVLVTSTSTPTATSTATQTPTPTLNHTPTPTDNNPPPLPTPTAIEGYGYVTIVDYSYKPALMTIHVGAIVTWENTDPTDHTATSDTGVWDSGTLAPTGKYQFQFLAAGNYPYHCSFHPDMTGMIIVVP